jgi:hypothetical protein
MGLGEILGEALNLYVKNMALMMAIAAAVYVPLTVIQLVADLVTEPPTLGQPMGGGGFIKILLNLLLIPFALFMTGAMTKAVADRYLDNSTSVGAAYGYVLERGGPYLTTVLLSALLVMVGMCLFVIPGIIFAFWTAFAGCVFVLEGHANVDAIYRSRALAAGNWGRLFVLGLLVLLITIVVQAIFNVPLALVMKALLDLKGIAIAATLAGGVAGIIIGPFSTIVLVLLYFDIRVRKEGFGLAHLAQSFQGKPPVAPPPPPPGGY